jgi:hypothetical protein
MTSRDPSPGETGQPGKGRDWAIGCAKIIAAHGPNITYPNRQSSQHLREVIAELLALVTITPATGPSELREDNERLRHALKRAADYWADWHVPCVYDEDGDCEICPIIEEVRTALELSERHLSAPGREGEKT